MLPLFALLLAAMPVQDLGHDVFLVRGGFAPGRQPDGNSVMLRGPEGWVLVDTGRHAQHTQKLIDHIQASDAPLRAIVNTHWHLDHVSGNLALCEKYPRVPVLASDAIEDALVGFLANARKQLEAMLVQPGATEEDQAQWGEEIARIDAGRRLAPTHVVRAAGQFELAGRTLELGLAEHAATAGDVWVYDPRAKVLIAGDLVTLPAPFFDTACAPRWRQALATLAATGFQTLVPGHGAPMTRAQFAQWRNAYDGLLECAASEATPAGCLERWTRDAGDLLQGEDPRRVQALVEYYVTQRLRGPGAIQDCPAD